MALEDDSEDFDTATRDRIRRKILHYAAQHKIGVFRLADRISKANPRCPEIPIKTLQRFLAGKIRTNGMHVGFLQKFADTLADRDPIGDLGRAMAEFHASREVDRFRGDYKSVTTYNGVTGRAPRRATFNITADQGFCRVTERSDEERFIIYDGALAGNETVAVISLQDRTTKAPKQYLMDVGDNGYSARGTEAAFEPGGKPALHSLFAEISKGLQGSERISGLHRSPPAPEPNAVPELHIPMPVPMIDASQIRSVPPDPKTNSGVLNKLWSMFKLKEPKPPVHETAKPTVPETKSSDPLDILESFLPAYLRETNPERLQAKLLIAAEQADEAELPRLVELGVDVNSRDPSTGLTALHLSIGRNSMSSVRFLVSRGASFIPDKFGRMPSVIAAESEVGDDLADFVAEAEARAESV